MNKIKTFVKENPDLIDGLLIGTCIGATVGLSYGMYLLIGYSPKSVAGYINEDTGKKILEVTTRNGHIDTFDWTDFVPK